MSETLLTGAAHGPAPQKTLRAALADPPPFSSGGLWWEQAPHTPPWQVARAATDATGAADGPHHLAAAFALTLAAWRGRPAARTASLEEALAQAVHRNRITASMARSYLAQIVAETPEPAQTLAALAHPVRALWARGISVDLVAVAQDAATLLGEDPLTRPGRRDLARRIHTALTPTTPAPAPR